MGLTGLVDAYCAIIDQLSNSYLIVHYTVRSLEIWKL